MREVRVRSICSGDTRMHILFVDETMNFKVFRSQLFNEFSLRIHTWVTCPSSQVQSVPEILTSSVLYWGKVSIHVG